MLGIEIEDTISLECIRNPTGVEDLVEPRTMEHVSKQVVLNWANV